MGRKIKMSEMRSISEHAQKSSIFDMSENLDNSESLEEIQEETIETEEQQGYIYVYGIIYNKDIKLDINGLKDKPIKKIDFEDISALISFYPTLHPVLKEGEAMQHADILKKLAKKTTIIPMSFGTVFKDQKILETILSSSYQAVKKTLALIDGKIELGVKVIKNQLNDMHDGVVLEILRSLAQLSVKSVKGDNFSERLLLNHSFLVEKKNFSKFSNKIAELESKHKNLKFLYTGPWPPYSFVNIKIAGG